jgi:chemotaxis protein methyltransferase CheR
VPEADRAGLRLDAERFEPAPALRDHVRFTHANLLEAEIAPAEAILCRNVLIYLTEPARAQVLDRLVAALRPGGVLLLGATDRPSPALGLRPMGREGLGIWSRGDG